MKRILITGAGSYIGTCFEKYIAEKFSADYMVDTLDMLNSEWHEKDFSVYDSVFHVAGIAHQKETKENAVLYYEVNRDLAIEVAQKAKRDGVKQFVFLSTMSVYGKTTGEITRETLPQPTNNYGKSKLQAENGMFDLKDDSFVISVVRPPMIYGKGCRGNYNGLAKFALKLPIFPNVNNQRSMLYIENLCEFVRLLINNCDGGIFFPQNECFVNTTKMAELICKANGKRFRCTKIFNWALAVAKKFLPLLNKAFGSLTYDMAMSSYRQNYNIIDFEQSIVRTESKY